MEKKDLQNRNKPSKRSVYDCCSTVAIGGVGRGLWSCCPSQFQLHSRLRSWSIRYFDAGFALDSDPARVLNFYLALEKNAGARTRRAAPADHSFQAAGPECAPLQLESKTFHVYST
ncbi:hypothetical protein EVAR_27059_1 [Eumeta japonica]|uniref:Uncharacterized protein n=1 Tax=Eumeta variegata TaxID=151549 RepID=A0A4C1WGU8_EUMVA|nr:hypothetical protein EVAR_27059_1 [Eumeta japonica]